MGKEPAMAKLVDCGKVNPASGCGHVIRGETEDDVLRQAAEHAQQAHGLQPTPALMQAMRGHIQEAEAMRILYTAEATATGGRAGHVRTADGTLDMDLSIPTEMGGPGGAGTNPEQLFAAGFAA
jgi:predicted small metal-binding protein